MSRCRRARAGSNSRRPARSRAGGAADAGRTAGDCAALPGSRADGQPVLVDGAGRLRAGVVGEVVDALARGSPAGRGERAERLALGRRSRSPRAAWCGHPPADLAAVAVHQLDHALTRGWGERAHRARDVRPGRRRAALRRGRELGRDASSDLGPRRLAQPATGRAPRGCPLAAASALGAPASRLAGPPPLLPRQPRRRGRRGTPRRSPRRRSSPPAALRGARVSVLARLACRPAGAVLGCCRVRRPAARLRVARSRLTRPA